MEEKIIMVFYKSFSMTYTYTRIGRITNTRGLKKAAGKGVWIGANATICSGVTIA